MYVPPSFRIDDPAKLSAFIKANSFATLVTCQEGVPLATHLPMRHFVEDGNIKMLVSHMARANPQWRHFEPTSEVLVIFSGPHAYISPTWYTVKNTVPTWNYAVVHVYGRPKIMADHDQVVTMLADTVALYERSFTSPWPYNLPVELRDKLIQAIVPFEVEVTRVEGKFKLGQNRSFEDNRGVYQALIESEDPESRRLAELMLLEGMSETEPTE